MNSTGPGKNKKNKLKIALLHQQGSQHVEVLREQHTQYMVSCIMSHLVDEQTQEAVLIKGLADSPVKTHLFRIELESLDQAITIAEQEDFSLKQAFVHSGAYRHPRRQEYRGPEPMVPYVESVKPRSSIHKRLQKRNRYQKTTTSMSVEPHAQCLETLSETIDVPLGTAEDAGPTLLRNRNGKADR